MSLPEDKLAISTPENVIFDFKVAGIGSRFLAALVDTAIITGVQIISVLIVILGYAVLQGGVDTSGAFYWAIAILGLLTFIIYWAYYISFEMLWNGQSPGKRWVGLRVIRTDGTPISLSESVIRNFLRIIDLLPVTYGVGMIVMFLNDQSRRLGDLAAGTLVVWDRKPVSLAALEEDRRLPPPSPELQANLAYFTHLPLDRLAEPDLDLARGLLARWGELENREALGLQILQTLYARMDLTAPTIQGDQVPMFLRGILLGREQMVSSQ